MTQMDLATAVGVTFQQVQKYENGKNRVSASRLQKIAKVLGVSESYFFDDLIWGSNASKSVPVDPKFEGLLASSVGVSLIRAFSRIKQPKMRRRILDLVEHLAVG